MNEPNQLPDRKIAPPAAVFLGFGMLDGTTTGMNESPLGAAIVAVLFGLLGEIKP